MSLVGETLNQRFYILETLSKGGFGHTYLAEDREYRSRPRCVVKHLQPRQENLSDTVLKTIKKLFKQEAEILNKLSLHSDLIPKLIDRFDEDDQLFIVQEFIDGAPLSTELKPSRKFSQAETIELLIQILTPLEYCHKEKLIHRDLKPDNIMRRKNGDLVLIDFGIAKDLGAAEFTKEFYGGTPGYAPGEQRDGKAEPASDVYAVGKIAIQALTGLRPTELNHNPQTSEWEWRSLCDVTDDFAAVLNRMVKLLAVNRYQNAAEALAAVSGLSTVRFKLRVKAKSSQWFSPVLVAPLAGIFILAHLGYAWYANHERQSRIEIYNNSGGANYKKGKYKEAVADYDKAVELDPKSARGYSGRCLAKFKLSIPEKALNDCKIAIELDPKLAVLYLTRGKIRYSLDKKEKEAIHDYNKSIELNPNFIEAYLDRARFKSSKYKFSDSYLQPYLLKEILADYDKAVELDPESVDIYKSRAFDSYHNLERYQEAIYDYDKIIKLTSNSRLINNSYEGRGNANHALGRYQEAINDYSRVIQLDPNNSYAYLARGHAESSLKKYQEAMSDYNKSLETYPEYASAYVSRGILKFDLKRYKEAIADFDRAIEIEPSHALEFKYRYRGDAKFNLKKYQEAIDDYDNIIKLDNTNSDAYISLGIAKNLMGQKKNAIADYQQAAKIYKELKNDEKYQEVLKKIQQLEK
jgi:serine/threonine protein kinase